MVPSLGTTHHSPSGWALTPQLYFPPPPHPRYKAFGGRECPPCTERLCAEFLCWSLPDDLLLRSVLTDCPVLQVAHQFSSVTQSCPTLFDPMNRSMPGLPVHHQLPKFTQTHIHRVSDAIQPSHPLSSPSPPAPNPSQHQSLFQ